MQTLIRRRVGDVAAGLGLHFLHMSEGPFSHDAGHICLYLFVLNIHAFRFCQIFYLYLNQTVHFINPKALYIYMYIDGIVQYFAEQQILSKNESS